MNPYIVLPSSSLEAVPSRALVRIRSERCLHDVNIELFQCSTEHKFSPPAGVLYLILTTDNQEFQFFPSLQALAFSLHGFMPGCGFSSVAGRSSLPHQEPCPSASMANPLERFQRHIFQVMPQKRKKKKKGTVIVIIKMSDD